MKFDAYAATIEDDPNGVLGQLLAAFPAAWSELTQARNGYTSAFAVHYCGNRATVSHRRKPDGGNETHVSVLGAWSQQLATHLRIVHPFHSVARLDAAADFDQVGFWDWLIPIALDLADDLHVSIDQRGDWERGGMAGRTLYLGSPESAVRMRIYEKGKQLRSQKEDPDASLHWVRLETQTRPQKRAKRAAWTWTPTEAFCTSKVATRLLSIIQVRDLPHVPPGYVRQPAPVSSEKFRNLVRSYGRFLLQLLDSMPAADLASAVAKQLDAPNAPDILQARPCLPADAAATERMLSLAREAGRPVVPADDMRSGTGATVRAECATGE